MAAIDAAYQAMIWTESGTTIIKSVALRFTLRNELFWIREKSFYSLICMHILRKKECLCMGVKAETVLLFPDIFLIFFPKRSIISTIINVTLVWKLEEKALLGSVCITWLTYLTATPCSILSAVPQKKNFILLQNIISK